MGSAIIRINFGRFHHGRAVLCVAWAGNGVVGGLVS